MNLSEFKPDIYHRGASCRRCGLPGGTAVHCNPFGAGHAYEPPLAATDARGLPGAES